MQDQAYNKAAAVPMQSMALARDSFPCLLWYRFYLNTLCGCGRSGLLCTQLSEGISAFIFHLPEQCSGPNEDLGGGYQALSLADAAQVVHS